ncbi:hypothetical protein RQP46_000094 [Phenoliferia psychrophenolica]
MATFESLPPEILIHIHKLSHEGESPQEQQRARFAFGLVARAFFLATADATEFHVAGAKQAKAFTAKLERDAVCVTLRLERNTFNNALICALANLTAGIKVLACTNFNIRSVPFAPVELLVPIVASLVDFTWTPGRGFIVGSNLSKGARDEILALLGAMKSLKSIHIALWIYVQQPILHLIDDYQPTDPGLFDTLATLPSLSTVKLLVNSGKLGEEHVISYLKSHDALRFLSTRFETDGRWTLSWTPEQRRRVEDASEGAGINFTYSEIHA